MEKNTTKNNYKNHEGYADPTPYNAINSIEGAETKAYHLFETIGHMARLAGFTIDGTVIMIGRNGRAHDGAKLKQLRQKQRSKADV